MQLALVVQIFFQQNSRPLQNTDICLWIVLKKYKSLKMKRPYANALLVAMKPKAIRATLTEQYLL